MNFRSPLFQYPPNQITNHESTKKYLSVLKNMKTKTGLTEKFSVTTN